ncbi:hypothetical protein DB30_05835 [Enhygromyxa salina]|uniref:Uncharacterized protein n=1 Tax=Enhygromyxa salina TaxID=215803 RepID=A0A0C2CZV0_9BACT|nr:hypothetical protein DB30_05835 [Enhygromyxa salina]
MALGHGGGYTLARVCHESTSITDRIAALRAWTRARARASMPSESSP